MSVSFNTIPSGIRVPLFYAEMDNSAAATPTSQTASLLIGQMGEGKAEAGKPVYVSTAAMAKDIRTAVFKVAQMKCENCVRKINNNIRFEKGLKDFHTDLKTKTVTITYDADKTNVEKLKEGFQKFHYEAEFVKETKQDDKK